MLVDKEDEVEKLLQVGLMVVLCTDPDLHTERRYRSFIRGWHRPFQLVVDRPKSRNRPAPLREDQPCVIRFANEGRACAFGTHIIDWENRLDAAYCRIAWPQAIEVASFRKHQRIPVALGCTIELSDGSKVKGQICDLSQGGCRMRADSEIPEGIMVKVSFTLPDGSLLDDVATIVRNARMVDGEMQLGCQFDEGQEDVEDHITFCIATLLDHERAATQRGFMRHILIIDDNPETSKTLRLSFEAQGWSAYSAASALDGLLRLRLLPPAALLVSQQQNDLPGYDLARTVKFSRGFELLPVFIYGPTQNGARQKAIEVGAREYFSLPLNMSSVCDSVIASAEMALEEGEKQQG